jgi:hypothetical protein
MIRCGRTTAYPAAGLGSAPGQLTDCLALESLLCLFTELAPYCREDKMRIARRKICKADVDWNLPEIFFSSQSGGHGSDDG